MARHFSLKNKKIYLDYAATTPVDALAEKAMRPYFTEKFGNPGSLHYFGQEAMAAVDESREKIAKAIGADFREVIFTGSATEANNLALRGVVRAARLFSTGTGRSSAPAAEAALGLSPSRLFASQKDQARLGSETFRTKTAEPPYRVRYFSKQSVFGQKNLPLRIIVSAIEHESVLETARDLAASFQEASLAHFGREKQGVEVIYLPVNKKGFVDLKKLEKSLNERTILVSVMYANNEIGTIQPIVEIAKIIRDFKNSKHEARNSKQIPNSKLKIQNNKISDFGFRISDLQAALPLVHTDAVQAFQYLDCDVNKLGVDLMTLSSHKIYGPKGIGALYVRNSKHEVRNSKQIQNYKLKIKNHNVSDFGFRISDLPAVQPLVTGGGQEFGFRSGTENVPSIVGFAKAVELAVKNRERESQRIKSLHDYFWQGLKKIEPRLQINGSLTSRLPNNLNVYWPSRRAEDLLVKFDLAGIAVSSGSACSARSTKLSHVLKAIGCGEKRIRESLRFTLGRLTLKAEIDEALKRIKIIL